MRAAQETRAPVANAFLLIRQWNSAFAYGICGSFGPAGRRRGSAIGPGPYTTRVKAPHGENLKPHKHQRIDSIP
jgi:hypothetical protein